MKRDLPQTIKTQEKGFTLVELLVAITIVAILAVVGFTLFSGIQAQARDSNRRTEVQEVAKALETHYIAVATAANTVPCPNFSGAALTNPGYCPLESAWFTAKGTGQNIPSDPSAGVYCIANTNDPDVGFTANPTWALADRGACPTGFSVLAPDEPAPPFRNFQVCAHMETTDDVYCQTNQQR
jgi:prepilin-type N-terminal cleavage/methylation domain-containing protein